eukprot:2481666-Rhodomonas_salina.1
MLGYYLHSCLERSAPGGVRLSIVLFQLPLRNILPCFVPGCPSPMSAPGIARARTCRRLPDPTQTDSLVVNVVRNVSVGFPVPQLQVLL